MTVNPRAAQPAPACGIAATASRNPSWTLILSTRAARSGQASGWDGPGSGNTTPSLPPPSYPPLRISNVLRVYPRWRRLPGETRSYGPAGPWIHHSSAVFPGGGEAFPGVMPADTIELAGVLAGTSRTGVRLPSDPDAAFNARAVIRVSLFACRLERRDGSGLSRFTFASTSTGLIDRGHPQSRDAPSPRAYRRRARSRARIESAPRATASFKPTAP